MRTLILAATLLAVCACTPRRIPGTDIEDTTDTRAILKVMEQYRTAVEARDAGKVLEVIADSFKDDMGTSTPSDDLDYPSLREKLPQSLAKLDEVKLDITVRKIEVSSAEGLAHAIYTYTTSFKMPGLSAKPQSDSEIKEMWFKKVAGDWKITSGI
ncbi:MAG: DUF4440 domain-containing protein [Myxococcaceae bacterium]